MKRLLDLCFSILGLIALSPLFILVAAGVKLTSKGAVLFRQERLGLDGVKFTIYKFRSMCKQEPGSGCQVTACGDSRITPFGRFLRRSKLDEIPQLFNVLRGDMSFVGPRPEVAEFAELFPVEYSRILKVRPGITHRGTLFFRREEEILASASDPRDFYIETLMPQKLAAYEANLEQSLAQDIKTIVETLVPRMGVVAYGPEHFAAAPAAATQDAAEIFPYIENIPAVPELVEAERAVRIEKDAQEVVAV